MKIATLAEISAIRAAERAGVKYSHGYYLLTTHSLKAEKGLKRGRLQAMLNLQPCYPIDAAARKRMAAVGFRRVGRNTCPYAGKRLGACLAECGHNSARLNRRARPARERKTRLLVADPAAFLAVLAWDLKRLQRESEGKGLLPVCRLNCLSDLDWPHSLIRAFPAIQFLDYTKDLDKAMEAIGRHWPHNYHLTFSYNERAEKHAPELRAIADSGRANIGVIFRTPRSKALPSAFDLGFGRRAVIDGDLDNLRFLDESGAIVGLRYKRPMKDWKEPRGFDRLVIDPE